MHVKSLVASADSAVRTEISPWACRMLEVLIACTQSRMASCLRGDDWKMIGAFLERRKLPPPTERGEAFETEIGSYVLFLARMAGWRPINRQPFPGNEVPWRATRTYSCWLNQVERLFGVISQQTIRRGTFTSVTELIRRIHESTKAHITAAKPFVWVSTAQSILVKVERLSTRVSGSV